MLYEFMVRTKDRFQIIDITDNVQRAVYRSKVKHGIAVVFTRHTTTGLMINEYERGLLDDIEARMKELIPCDSDYLHNRIDNNAHAHLRASLLLNPEVVVPIDQAELQLGTWQRILLVELDGPRERNVYVMICPCPEFPEE